MNAVKNKETDCSILKSSFLQGRMSPELRTSAHKKEWICSIGRWINLMNSKRSKWERFPSVRVYHENFTVQNQITATRESFGNVVLKMVDLQETLTQWACRDWQPKALGDGIDTGVSPCEEAQASSCGWSTGILTPSYAPAPALHRTWSQHTFRSDSVWKQTPQICMPQPAAKESREDEGIFQK